jgi:sigma-B regulation protein RsbU (phosphoserine phosphatase)
MQVDPSSRPAVALKWLTTSFAGRTLVLGAAIKVIALLLKSGLSASGAVTALDTIGDVLIVVAVVTIGYSLFVDTKRVILWRVRRKLTLSYIFIAFVPALLLITFFVLSGLLLFFSVSAYSVRMQFNGFEDQAGFLAQTAAVDLARNAGRVEIERALRNDFNAVAGRYPLVAYAVVPTERACRGTAALPSSTAVEAPPVTLTAGGWRHVSAPTEVPAWVPCDGLQALIAFRSGNDTYAAARAVQWVPNNPNQAVIVDLPIDAAALRKIGEGAGVETGPLSTADEVEARADSQGSNQRRRIVGSASTPAPDGSSPILRGLAWVAVLDHVNWTTGEPGTLWMSFRMSPLDVYQRISGPSLRGMGPGLNFNLGQVWLFIMGTVGVLFLIIQLVAFGMGLALARSITGSVHELFEGTERVGRGDFSHKIAVRSRDQLGELASSFNSMTTSIEYLLQEKAVKERLEQELRIARSIQMSLLPQGPLQVPGIALVPHCEPAREVGGDYYDYIPLDRHRVGLLIADVSGKGTSAALYMAELKGIILSLSERHTSPRQLLINANQIISRHLDTRSFITITYAMLDLDARTLTYARAGHCPLIHVPGPQAASRAAQILVPDGMVLGLQLDDGQMFEQSLQESTVAFAAGDLFLFYTDGLSETMNPEGDCFGDARLAELLERHADLPPTEIRERVLREVQAFAGTADQQDDMTMLLLGIQDVPQTAERPAGAILAS